MIDEGYALVGTVDSVTRALERLLRRVPLEVLVVAVWNGLIPHAANLRSLERFANVVLPRVADLEQPPVPG